MNPSSIGHPVSASASAAAAPSTPPLASQPTSPALSSIPSAFSSPTRPHHHETGSVASLGSSYQSIASASAALPSAGRRYGHPQQPPPPPASSSSAAALRHASYPHPTTAASSALLATPGSSTAASRFKAGTLDTQSSMGLPASGYTPRATHGGPSPMRGGGVARGTGGGSGLYPSLAPAPAAEDKNVLLHVHYGTRVVFRGPKGVTLSATQVGDSSVASPPTPTGPATPGSSGGGAYASGPSFRACPEGSGLGAPQESFMMVNCNRRDDRGPMAYGSSVALRCGWAKERFLGVNHAGEVGFWRTLIGSPEKWLIVRPDVIKSSRSHASGASSSSFSTPKSSGSSGWVLAGDPVVLQSASSREVLVVRDTPEGGLEVTLCPPESALLSHATWLLGWAGTPLYPAWNLTRPHLTGDFLLQPHRHQLSSLQEEVFQVLPHAANRDEARHAPRPLAQCSPAEQERLLVEDLLWVVYGYEGKYIKAEGLTAAGVGAGGGDAASLEDVRFQLVETERHTMDPSLASMVAKFLPLGAHCLRIRRFVDAKRRYDYGMVAQALAAGLHDLLLKSYALLLAQLEHKLLATPRGLTLQQLWFHLQPSLRTLQVLDALCVKVGRSKGGALLNLLREAASGSGDDKSAQMQAFLLEKAAAPYMVMLEGWIHQGVLADPYREFMVREEQSLAKENVQEDFNAAYWDARSTIRPEHVFSVLEEFKPQILTTGKYLNVIRECGQDLGAGQEGGEASPAKLRYAAGKAALGEAIDAAYRRACRLLLDVVLRQHRLLSRLSSIKHYFLLDKGDFFVHFMNTAERELLKGVSEVLPSRLESLLHLSIQMSVASHDPYKDNVSSTFSKHTLIEHLNAIHKSDRFGADSLNASMSASLAGSSAAFSSFTPAAAAIAAVQEASLPELPNLLGELHVGEATGRMSNNSTTAAGGGGIKAYEAFMLESQVKWPLSLVVSRRAVTKYQLLFRHLFLVKFVERRLHTSWAEQQSTKELDVRGALGLAFCLRHKMQHFLENYIYYMMFEVIEPHWHVLSEALRTGEGVEHVDDVIRRHQAFQDSCLKECLLTDQSLLKILNKIIVVCMLFAAYMEQATQDLTAAAEAVTGGSSSKSKGKLATDPAASEGHGGLCIPATDGGGGGAKRGGRGKHVDAGAARRDRLARQTAEVRARASSSGFVHTMEAFDKNLDFHTQDFMRRLWEGSQTHHHAHLSNLLERLDYNGFFAAQFAHGAMPPPSATTQRGGGLA